MYIYIKNMKTFSLFLNFSNDNANLLIRHRLLYSVAFSFFAKYRVLVALYPIFCPLPSTLALGFFFALVFNTVKMPYF